VNDIARVDLKRKTVLFSQTTMDKPTFYEIARVLREKIADVVIGTFEESAVDFHAKDTICGQVAGRDKKLREFAAANEIMIFVAGRNSSNGKVLYDICREANPRSYFVEREQELDPAWFEGVATVGISGATSTPQWLMEQVQNTIEEIAVRHH
jgi:4-hydroxy-3-methylbut-2-enyl diphosphate reductase